MPPDQESKTRNPCSWLEPPRQGEMHPSPDKKVTWAPPDAPQSPISTTNTTHCRHQIHHQRHGPELGGEKDVPPPAAPKPAEEKAWLDREPWGGAAGRGRSWSWEALEEVEHGERHAAPGRPAMTRPRSLEHHPPGIRRRQQQGCWRPHGSGAREGGWGEDAPATAVAHREGGGRGPGRRSRR